MTASQEIELLLILTVIARLRPVESDGSYAAVRSASRQTRGSRFRGSFTHPKLLAPECQAEHRALPIGAPSRNHPKKLLHIRD